MRQHEPAVYERFWKSMEGRFGKPWIDKHGPSRDEQGELIIPRPWCDLLDRYSLETINAALDAMNREGWEHPPGLPPFAELLAAAQRKRDRDVELTPQRFWRGFINGSVVSFAHRYGPHVDSRGRCFPVRMEDALRGLCQALEYRYVARELTHGRTDRLLAECYDELHQQLHDAVRAWGAAA